MSGPRPFDRQLGYHPGVQLNPLGDNTDGVAPGISDQVVATVGRFTRGRIDRAFRVNQSNLVAKLGKHEPLRANQLNEARLQLYESLRNGAQEAVVYRLNTSAATKKWALIKFDNGPATFNVAADTAGQTYDIAVMHHDCHNDGIKVAVHADVFSSGGIPVLNPMLTLRVLDSEGAILHEFTGSALPDAKDDFGESAYLPDIVSSRTESLTVLVHGSMTGVPTTSNAYGRGADGRDQWPTSPVLICFVEGPTIYQVGDYDRAIDALRRTTDAFGYVISGGTQVISLLAKIADLAMEINVPFKLDYSGQLTPEAVLALDASLNLTTNHMTQRFWAPFSALDPASGGRSTWGTSGINAGYSSARNARVNAKGFARKNEPIAGPKWPINRTGLRQLYEPDFQEKSDLAKAQINAVLPEHYNSGSKYVYTDCLTSFLSRVSYKRLATAAEMAASLENWVAMASKEKLMLPMSQYLREMDEFLKNLLEDAETSKWLVKSKNLPNGAAFIYRVYADDLHSNELAHIEWWPCFDGIARKAILQQTLSS